MVMHTATFECGLYQVLQQSVNRSRYSELFLVPSDALFTCGRGG